MTLNESTRKFILSQIKKAREKAESAERGARAHEEKEPDLALAFLVDAEVNEAKVERLEQMLIKNQIYL